MAKPVNRVKGAMRRVHMPDAINSHPNQATAESFNRMTTWAENINGPEAARIADRVQRNYGAATAALGNVIARRHEAERERAAKAAKAATPATQGEGFTRTYRTGRKAGTTEQVKARAK